VAFFEEKKTKRWVLKAVDRRTRRTIAWVIGQRDTATVKRLYEKLKHLKKCTFYTDDWDAFAAVLPKDRHVIGKKHTITIEQNNSDTRHKLARMIRRTKVVSHSETMIHLSLCLWAFAEIPDNIQKWLQTVRAIF
jgi:insertion element IS1 protein InsB